MPSPDATLEALFARILALFPATRPLVLRSAVEPFAPHAARYSGGHAARWFATIDGQRGDDPFADGHALCSLAYALDAAKIADEIRSGPEGYWVDARWLAIASDGAGQHVMIDDRDGRVLAVAHDDDHVRELASSPEAWLKMLIDGHAAGSIVWDDVFGLVEAEKLEDVREHQRAQSARSQQRAQISTKHKIGLVMTAVVIVAIVLVAVWTIETHR